MTWSAEQYLRFEDERTRPARDLLAQVPLAEPRRVVDIGCGPGNSTALLVERFPQAEITGVDTSPEMLAEARRRLPAIDFVIADAADWTPSEPVDVVFANAVFQWVPDHLAVLARLTERLAPGGVLAIQVPDNLGEPDHVAMRAVAEAGPWAERFATPIARDAIHQPAIYYDRLTPLAGRVDIWRTIYHHPLEGASAIVEWVKGTGLRPYLDRLAGNESEAFVADYRARLEEAYPPLADGKVLLPFPRLFVVATRA